MSNSQHIRALAIGFIVLSWVASCGTKATPVPQTPSHTSSASGATAQATTVPVLQHTTPPEAATPTAVTVTPTLALSAAALVNGQAVLLDEYEAEVRQALAVLSEQQSFDPGTEEGKAALQQLRHQILDAMIDQVLIEQAAAREGITVPEQQVSDEMAGLIGDDATQFEEWLKANNLTREAFEVQLQRQLLSAAVQEHVLGSEVPLVEQVHARHILLSSEDDAMTLLLRLQSGESFSDLAQQFSQDEASSELDGDLGFFPRNVMPPGIEAAAFGLESGQISGIVKTDFGYHIIEVLEKDPSRQVPEEMLATWRQNTFLSWLEAHRAVAKVRYLIPLED